VVHRVSKVAFVDNTIGVARDAASGDFPVEPIALIGAAIGEIDNSEAFGLSGAELTFVQRSVGEARRTGPADFAFKPFACIFISVEQGVGAHAVLQPVEELALIDAAVVVLFGLHRLGERRGGEHQGSNQVRCKAQHGRDFLVRI
jgi:hypothetical protein